MCINIHVLMHVCNTLNFDEYNRVIMRACECSHAVHECTSAHMLWCMYTCTDNTHAYRRVQAQTHGIENTSYSIQHAVYIIQFVCKRYIWGVLHACFIYPYVYTCACAWAHPSLQGCTTHVHMRVHTCAWYGHARINMSMCTMTSMHLAWCA